METQEGNIQQPGAFSQAGVSLVVHHANFGELLQKKRLEADLSVADAAAAANATKTTLQAMETGNFSAIDLNPMYCLSLIERLCLAYRLTPEETETIKETFELDLRDYQIQSGLDPDNPNPTRHLTEEHATPSHRRPSAILISLLIVLLVALILGGYLYKGYQKFRLKQEQTDYNLPALLEPPRLPLDALPIPNS